MKLAMQDQVGEDVPQEEPSLLMAAVAAAAAAATTLAVAVLVRMDKGLTENVVMVGKKGVGVDRAGKTPKTVTTAVAVIMVAVAAVHKTAGTVVRTGLARQGKARAELSGQVTDGDFRKRTQQTSRQWN